jgi:protein gp37
MAELSKIEWTDATWNPVRGCTKISPGCAHCYAETFAERFRGISGHPYEQGFDLRLVPEKLLEPLRWPSQKMVFVNSMSDLFHEDVPSNYISAVAEVMKNCSWHIYQVLTKRSARMRDMVSSELRDAANSPHIWWGISVENRKYGLPRIKDLRNTPAAVRFLSIEPLLEDLGTINLQGIHWVIVGGESGPGARPMDPDWVNSLREQCRLANIPFFFKQWGGVRKKQAGRELDGQTLDEFPRICRTDAPSRIKRLAILQSVASRVSTLLRCSPDSGSQHELACIPSHSQFELFNTLNKDAQRMEHCVVGSSTLDNSDRAPSKRVGNRQDSSSSGELARLISQLEQSKFARLFRHLINSHEALPRAGNDIGKPAVALDLPDVELQFKLAGSVGSFGHCTVAWLFQIAHAPEFLLDTQFASTFIRNHLRRAFVNLRTISTNLQSATSKVDYLTAFHSASEGCDHYYLFTNIFANIEEKALQEFSTIAHELYSEIVGVPPGRHPAFGIATPETLAGETSRLEVKRFIVDLLNIPSSYYFVAREGRISVVPVTEHGAFLAAHDGQSDIAVPGLSTVITSKLGSHNNSMSLALADLEVLINSSHTREADLQRFFVDHPEFLFALDEKYCDVRPHVCLFDSAKEKLVPDLMARIQDSNIWNIIELKLPQSQITTCSGEVERASAAAARGIAELLRYRDFFSVRDNRARVMNRFTTAPYEPSLVLIIGRGRTDHRYEWASTRSGFPNVEIVSYDYLFQQARQRAAALCRKLEV